MFIELDGTDINVELRCYECDEVLDQVSRWDDGKSLVIEVELHTCGEEK